MNIDKILQTQRYLISVTFLRCKTKTRNFCLYNIALSYFLESIFFHNLNHIFLTKTVLGVIKKIQHNLLI